MVSQCQLVFGRRLWKWISAPLTGLMCHGKGHLLSFYFTSFREISMRKLRIYETVLWENVLWIHVLVSRAVRHYTCNGTSMCVSSLRPDGLQRHQDGNVRRFTSNDDDDDNATWNGNSTQQMWLVCAKRCVNEEIFLFIYCTVMHCVGLFYAMLWCGWLVSPVSLFAQLQLQYLCYNLNLVSVHLLSVFLQLFICIKIFSLIYCQTNRSIQLRFQVNKNLR